MSRSSEQIARFESYVVADPQNTSLWVSLGDLLHSDGSFDRAAEAFTRVLQIDPSHAVAQARLGNVSLSRGRFSEAERIFRELIARGEQDPAVIFNLGLAQYYRREFQGALETFERVTHLPEARYRLISCLHNLQREEEAIARAHDFLQERDSSELRGLMALVMLDAGHASDAVAQARVVAEIHPDNADAAAVLSTHALENQEMDSAAASLNVLVAREPRNVRGWQGLALIELHAQRHDAALEHLERARQCDPANTGTLTTIGWTHLTRHEYARAEQTFRDGLAIDHNDAELHGGFASALVMQRRFDEARQEIARAVGLDRHCFGAVFAQSVLLRLAGNEQQSTKLMSRMLMSSPREGGPTLLDGLIRFWRTQRHLNGAAQRDVNRE